jgi:N-acetylmuramoyl-L-alanine amidase
VRPGIGPGAVPVPGGKVVVLDPGHGGKDNGTSKLEKVHALDVAARAKKILEAAGFKVVMTRAEDVYLTLAERPAIALANKADLFVSIHFNALPRDAKTSGVEVYTFPPPRQRGTNAWSPGERNNAEDEASPVNRHDYWSSALAHAIHGRFVNDLKAFDRGKKLMHLGVLRPLRCPGVLLECGFLTSEVEAKKIATPAYRQQLAQAIAAGIRDYAAVLDAARKKN